MIKINQLEALCAYPEEWIDALNYAMEQFAIINTKRITMFLATCAHESGRFRTLEENLNYSADGLLTTFGSRFTSASAVDFARQPQRIANHVYANRSGNGNEDSGDGWNYRGRGPIQITFRNNYTACGLAIRLSLLDNPELLTKPEAGALSAGWFWQQAGCNAVADEDDFAGVSGLVNRGSRHKLAANMHDREQWFTKAQNAFS